MLSIDTLKKFDCKFQNSQTNYDNQISLLEEERKKEIEEINKKYNLKINEIQKKKIQEFKTIHKNKVSTLIKETSVKSLKRQAYENYVIGFSKMTKLELIEKVEMRIKSEIILTLPTDLFNYMLSFTTFQEQLKLKQVSKVFNKRVKIDKINIDLEKFIKDIPKLKSENIVEKIYKINKFYERKPTLEDNQSIIVNMVKAILAKTEQSKLKNEKIDYATSIMNYVTSRTKFVKKHKHFQKTVYLKLQEFKEQFIDDDKKNINFQKSIILYEKRLLSIVNIDEFKCKSCGEIH